MKFCRTSLAIAVALSLTGCGGGGGGPSATMGPIVRSDVPYHAPVRINSFQPHHEPSQYRTPLTEIYTRDLNGNGSDEVLWSNVAFDYTGQNWVNSQVQVFGFNTGKFANETASWFKPGDNVYTGGFRINFGDFNGSGFDDVFLATFTDTPNHNGPSVMLENTVTTIGGVSQFRRTTIDFGAVLHTHDSVVADFNGDGIKDILKTGSALLLGSSTGNFTVYRSPACCVPGSAAGAGLSAADYMGDGSVTVIMTDGPGQDGSYSDTILFRPRITNGELFMEQIAVLPADRFFLPKWDGIVDRTAQSPHAVRNVAMDFNADGRPDVVVFSTMPKAGSVHGWTEVQFLRNDGAGSFTDVTDSVLSKFEHGKTVTYNPALIDVNNDGLLDIFMSTTDYTGQSSTSVLVATREGQFIESYVQIFDSFAQQIKSTTINGGTNQPIAIVAGPDNTRYLVSGVEYQRDGVAQIAVYASLIGRMGTATAPATIAALQQIWPWMSPAEANEVLARTSSSLIEGLPVIDLERIWAPVGDLTLTMHGQRQQLSGHVSVPGFNAANLKNITALDDLGRDFRVDLAAMSLPVQGLSADHILSTADPQQNWSSRLIGESTVENLGFSVTGRSSERFASSVSTRRMGVTQDWDINLGIARMPGSPWMSFSGVFGTIKDSVMVDTTLGRSWSNGMFFQTGLMQTTTRFQPGLIDSITPLWSASAMAGWQDQAWSLYGGLQPTIISGSMSMLLPTGVNRQGQVQLSRYSTQIRNDPVMFAGFQRRWRYQDHSWALSGAANDQGSYRMQLHYRKDF